jgi:hypothetical protein
MFTTDFEIHPLVEAACCITSNGKGYDIDKDFNSWVREYIKNKLKTNENRRTN